MKNTEEKNTYPKIILECLNKDTILMQSKSENGFIEDLIKINIQDCNLKLHGERIREERKKRGLTQEKLMEKLGYSPEYRNTLSSCENGKSFANALFYKSLSEFFNVRIDYLLGISDFKSLEDCKSYVDTREDTKYYSCEEYLSTFFNLFDYKIEYSNYESIKNSKYFETTEIEKNTTDRKTKGELNNIPDTYYKITNLRNNETHFISAHNMVKSLNLYFELLKVLYEDDFNLLSTLDTL